MEVRTSIILPAVEPRLDELNADEEVATQALEQLLRNLQQHPAGYRANRDEEDPDFNFTVPVPLLLRGRMRLIRFSLNDTISPDHFFVVAVSMSG